MTIPLYTISGRFTLTDDVAPERTTVIFTPTAHDIIDSDITVPDARRVTLGADGSFSIQLAPTDEGSSTWQYKVTLMYADPAFTQMGIQPKIFDYGWISVTGDGDIATLIAPAPAPSLSFWSAITEAQYNEIIEARDLVLEAADSTAALVNGAQVNVVNFMLGVSDQAAFQAAINSLPSVDNFAGDGWGGLNAGELPTYEIFVPRKPSGLSTDLEKYYVLNDSVLIGKRDIVWIVDSGARFGAANGGFLHLNSKVIHRGNIHMFGFSQQNKRTNLALTQGRGALGYDGMQAGISGYNPNTVQTQAFQHERGAANAYLSISDSHEIQVAGAGVTFSATRVFFATPLSESLTDYLRIGMVVDTIGNMETGVPLRHTTRITSFSVNGLGQCTDLFVETWHRMTTVPPYTSATASTPLAGTDIIINPVNKMWSLNTNLYLTKTNGATYGFTSGSIFEAGVFNNTGTRAGTEFERDTHPLHVWAFDVPHLGSQGGGIAFIVRGAQNWDRAFENRSALIGFHNHGTEANNGGKAFVSSAGYDGGVDGWGAGTPFSDFEARTLFGGAYDTQYRLVGGSPIIQLGRRTTASSPKFQFFADGLAAADQAAWDAEWTVTSTGGGTSVFNSLANTIFLISGTERARVTSVGFQVTGLISGTAVTQTQVDSTPGRLIKVGDFGLGATVAPTVADCNSITLSGFYYADGGAANKPMGNTGNYLIIHTARLTTTATQLAISRTVVGGLGVIFSRVNDAGVWTPWVMAFSQNNLLGTVSQSAGVPTGAIVERGSNANGEYVRYADGTQICTGLITLPAAATASGSIFTNAAETTWTFPIAFGTTTGLSTSATVRSSLDIWAKSRGVNSSSASVKAFSAATSAATPSAEVMAIGRWF